MMMHANGDGECDVDYDDDDDSQCIVFKLSGAWYWYSMVMNMCDEYARCVLMVKYGVGVMMLVFWQDAGKGGGLRGWVILNTQTALA